jgi:transcriptional regulator with XRE-family HTH domain
VYYFIVTYFAQKRKNNYNNSTNVEGYLLFETQTEELCMARRAKAPIQTSKTPFSIKEAFDMNRPAGIEVNQAGETQDENSTEVQLGLRLRDLRQEQNLSLRALAARSGLAINTLSMIENGRTSPSVSTLQILSRALDVSITAFFDRKANEKTAVYTRHNERPQVTIDATHLENLGSNLAGGAVQPFVVSIEAKSTSGQNTIVHTGHEFVYCLSGRIRYTIEGQDHLLEPGDSVVFESHLPHHWENPDDSPAQIILVLFPSDARDNPAERHFPVT